MSGLVKLIEAFASLRVLVVGDAMLDVYLRGSSDRLCQEAPVPVVSLRERHEAPGGACNTALNAAALGARRRIELLLRAASTCIRYSWVAMCWRRRGRS